MSFELLSPAIRKYVRDKRWEQLRPIQAAAIEKILTTDNNYILASRTASGKTEAAFLPILSKTDFGEEGVQVLYVSPLIALINDQFLRIEELCKYLDVNVIKWHGEANKALKERLVKQPNGIVLITPESLEAMFVNKPYQIKHLFQRVKYVVIDEVHSFIGTDRGVHLKSLLSRIQQIATNHFITIGLSATIGDYNEAKKFTGNEPKTKVLLDRSTKDIAVAFRYFEAEGTELPLDLLKDLYLETKDNKALIFPNNRGRAEEVAVKLKKIAGRVNGHSNYFSHHSSIDKEVREFVEYFAKNNKRMNFCIACTSTLELGIDIGTVEEVVQIDATHSIASLIQRVGRSGRRDGESSNLFLYATNRWSLLQSLACWLLYKDGFIEPPLPMEYSYDILLHQTLSIAKGRSGMPISELVRSLKSNYAFGEIEEGDIANIVDHLLEMDFLERIQNEVIIGVTGERVVNGREFYTVFKTEENFKVIHGGRTIGELPVSPQVAEGANILLAARMWTIVFVDGKAKKIEVEPAKDGKKPLFLGGSANVHPRVREKMMEILFSNMEYEFLDESGTVEISQMRKEFSAFSINNYHLERPLFVKDIQLRFFSFTGTRINRTLSFLFSIAKIDHVLDEASSSFELNISLENFKMQWKNMSDAMNHLDIHLRELLAKSPGLLDFSKWGSYLPREYQIKLLKQKYYDFEGVTEVMNAVLVENIP